MIDDDMDGGQHAAARRGPEAAAADAAERPDKAPQLRAIGAELTSRIIDLESRVAELEAVPTAGHADDDWQ